MVKMAPPDTPKPTAGTPGKTPDATRDATSGTPKEAVWENDALISASGKDTPIPVGREALVYWATLDAPMLLEASQAAHVLVKTKACTYRRTGTQQVTDEVNKERRAQRMDPLSPVEPGWINFSVATEDELGAEARFKETIRVIAERNAKKPDAALTYKAPKLRDPLPEEKNPEAPEPQPKRLVWRLHISAAGERAQLELANLAVKYRLREFSCANRPLLAAIASGKPKEVKTNVGSVVVTYDKHNSDGKKVNWDNFLKEASAIIARYPAQQEIKGGRKVAGHAGMVCLLEPENLRREWSLDTRDGESMTAPPRPPKEPLLTRIMDKLQKYPKTREALYAGTFLAAGGMAGLVGGLSLMRNVPPPSGIPLEPEASVHAKVENAPPPVPVKKPRPLPQPQPSATKTQQEPLAVATIAQPPGAPKLAPQPVTISQPEPVSVAVEPPKIALSPQVREEFLKKVSVERAMNRLGIDAPDAARSVRPVQTQEVTDPAEIAAICQKTGLQYFIPTEISAKTIRRVTVTSGIYNPAGMADWQQAIIYSFKDDKGETVAESSHTPFTQSGRFGGSGERFDLTSRLEGHLGYLTTQTRQPADGSPAKQIQKEVKIDAAGQIKTVYHKNTEDKAMSR